MTEQDLTPDITADDSNDTEGHARHFGRDDQDDADDTMGHARQRDDQDDADDTEGHRRM
jgi:hypothetical protein